MFVKFKRYSTWTVSISFNVYSICFTVFITVIISHYLSQLYHTNDTYFRLTVSFKFHKSGPHLENV